MIPVSAARAARDAATAAASARQRGRGDALRLARRIAAALNASDNNAGDYGFFWITAVTTDGSIVVANSYGLAYIPDGMELPNKVYLASADHAIPVDEIARCATYPVLAVQAWAAFHDMTLRAVIGTAEQLASSDPGVAKIVLEPDDIPESGKMTGRSRLEVVDPSAAAQLADTTDQRLLDLLPPAPVDVNPPGDERHMLWFELMKPMTSTATGREAAHLRAFRAYAAHSQEIALHQAHTATDAAVQRVAVADWLYWQYVTGLLDRALAAGPWPPHPDEARTATGAACETEPLAGPVYNVVVVEGAGVDGSTGAASGLAAGRAPAPVSMACAGTPPPGCWPGDAPAPSSRAAATTSAGCTSPWSP